MITNNVLYEKFTGDGSASTFTLTSLEYLHDGGNLKITRYDSSLALSVAEVVLEYGTYYTVDTANNTITIIDDPNPDVTVPYASTVTLTVTTNLDYTQGIDITSNSNYDPEVLESGYDKSVILAKQNKESIDRTIKVSQTDTGANLEIPPLEGSSGGYIYITNDGGSPPNYSLKIHPGPVPKIWDPLYEYQVGDITQENGDMWICKTVDTGTQPGTDISIWERYVDRFSKWNDSITYNIGDGGWYNGLLYVSQIDGNLGIVPGTDSSWKELNIYGTRWHSSVQYLQNDITSYIGVLVRAKRDNKGVIPSIIEGNENDDWAIIKSGTIVNVIGESGSETLVEGNLVYFDNGIDLSTDAGKLLLADNRTFRKTIVAGFVNGVSGTTITIQSVGMISGFTGLTVGETYYLGQNGNIVLRSGLTNDDYIVPIGIAKSATEISINIQFSEPKANMPKVIDLTSGDYTYALPAITGAPQKKSIYWTGGDTYKLTIKDNDGNTLDYNGEGNGHAVFESDGVNWQVLEYEDSKEFYAYKSATTTVTANTTIIFDTLESQIGNMYDNTTGIMTVPVTGRYNIHAEMLTQANNTSGSFKVIKNSATFNNPYGVASDTSLRSWNTYTRTLYLTKGDSIEIRPVYDTDVQGSASMYTNFSAVFLGA